MLLSKVKTEDWKTLISGYNMLTQPDQMGHRFKFMAVMDRPNPDYIPAGFHTPEFLKNPS